MELGRNTGRLRRLKVTELWRPEAEEHVDLQTVANCYRDALILGLHSRKDSIDYGPIAVKLVELFPGATEEISLPSPKEWPKYREDCLEAYDGVLCPIEDYVALFPEKIEDIRLMVDQTLEGGATRAIAEAEQHVAEKLEDAVYTFFQMSFIYPEHMTRWHGLLLNVQDKLLDVVKEKKNSLDGVSLNQLFSRLDSLCSFSASLVFLVPELRRQVSELIEPLIPEIVRVVEQMAGESNAWAEDMPNTESIADLLVNTQIIMAESVRVEGGKIVIEQRRPPMRTSAVPLPDRSI